MIGIESISVIDPSNYRIFFHSGDTSKSIAVDFHITDKGIVPLVQLRENREVFEEFPTEFRMEILTCLLSIYSALRLGSL
jgi:hypothetical protein